MEIASLKAFGAMEGPANADAQRLNYKHIDGCGRRAAARLRAAPRGERGQRDMGQRNHRAGGRYYYYELLFFALLGISCGGLAALFNAINVSLAVGRIKYPPRPCHTDVHTAHTRARTHTRTHTASEGCSFICCSTRE